MSLIFLRDRPTLLRAQRGKVSCALFAPEGHLKRNTAFVMDNRRSYYSRSGSAVFCYQQALAEEEASAGGRQEQGETDYDNEDEKSIRVSAHHGAGTEFAAGDDDDSKGR